MKRKVLVAALIAAALIFALWVSYDYFRLAIIKATIGMQLPGWLLALIWGW